MKKKGKEKSSKFPLHLSFSTWDFLRRTGTAIVRSTFEEYDYIIYTHTIHNPELGTVFKVLHSRFCTNFIPLAYVHTYNVHIFNVHICSYMFICSY